MSILDTLVTDRTQADRIYLENLLNKGWEGMTEDERRYFMGRGEVPLEDLEGFSLYSSDGFLLLAIATTTVVKGAYNTDDINRVDNAVTYLAETALALLKMISAYRIGKGVAADAVFLLPYTESDVVVSALGTPWPVSFIPTEEYLSNYLQNVKTIRGLVPVGSNAPGLPETMEDLTVAGANAIEASLLAGHNAMKKEEDRIKGMIDKTAAAWSYSGEIFSGEV